MEKNVIKSGNIVLWSFVILFNFFSTKVQNKEQTPKLTKAQYEFLESVFDEKMHKYKTVNYQPKNTNLWVNKFLNSRSENGIGTCLFDDPKLKEALDLLQISKFKISTYDEKKFPKTITSIKNSNRKEGLNISEPILLGSYSFLLIWNNRYEAVEIYHNDLGKGWKFKCFAILSGKL